MLIGLWASCPSVGDIIGQQLFLAITKNNIANMGYTFITLGVIILCFGILNWFCLIEFPSSKGITIKEEGKLLNPGQLTAENLHNDN